MVDITVEDIEMCYTLYIILVTTVPENSLISKNPTHGI